MKSGTEKFAQDEECIVKIFLSFNDVNIRFEVESRNLIINLRQECSSMCSGNSSVSK